jgi:hypothetical protein
MPADMAVHRRWVLLLLSAAVGVSLSPGSG